MTYKAHIEVDTATALHLPRSERVLDKLADILFSTDEILGILAFDEQALDERTAGVQGSVQSLYDQVNELMKQLSD